MARLNQLITQLDKKIEKLMALYRNSREESRNLAAEKAALLNQIEKQQNQIQRLSEKNKIVKLAKSLGDTDERSSDVKLKINELVREVDKCIAQLNR